MASTRHIGEVSDTVAALVDIRSLPIEVLDNPGKRFHACSDQACSLVCVGTYLRSKEA
jgi:hypothetical protein